MKKYITASVIFACLLSSKSMAQKYLTPIAKQDTVLVSDIKTTHLLFDQKITYLDIGSPYFVADTTQQMVKLKHIGQELVDVRSQTSNLTVITEDGGYYSLLLSYQRFLDNLAYKVKRTDQFAEAIQAQATKKKEKLDELQMFCDQLNKQFNNKIHIKNEKSEDLIISVTGLYYIREKIAIRLELENNSRIDFDIDHVLFRTKLKKRFAKDYLYQERVVEPIHTCVDNYEISGNGKKRITLVFDKFMLNEKERLAVDVFESNGGRSATINIQREDLLKPTVL